MAKPTFSPTLPAGDPRPVVWSDFVREVQIYGDALYQNANPDDRQASQVSAEKASASADVAAGNASAAETSKNAAVTAALAAQANVYSSVAAGEAATSNGDYFTVIGTNTLTVYENVSGTGTQRGSLTFTSSTTNGVYIAQDLGVDGSGSADQTATLNTVFASAAGSGGEVILAAGTYNVNGALTVASNVTVRFQPGAKISFGASGTCTWNGRVDAHAYQHIFSGTLVTGSYAETTDTPYTFTVTGSAKNAWASPFWFGALGDNVQDDSVEIYCALYWFKSCYLPRATYKVGEGETSGRIQLRQSGMAIWGDGPGLTTVANDGSGDDGGVIGLRGLSPTTASGDPREFVEDCYVGDLTVDGADATNTNGVGMSFARRNIVRNVVAQNIGRKAFTLQFHCYDNEFQSCRVVQAAQETGSTAGAIALEGQGAGINFGDSGGIGSAEYPGSTSDLQGADLIGNILNITGVSESGFNYVVIKNGTSNRVHVENMGDCTGSGTHISLTAFSKDNHVSFGRAGDSERRFVRCEANTSNNLIEGRWFGQTTGTLGDGYAIDDLGTRNTYRGISFRHANTATSGQRTAIRVSGNETIFDKIVCRGSTQISVLEALTGTEEITLIDCSFSGGTTRLIRLLGPRAQIRGGVFFATSIATGIQVQGNDCLVTGAIITGNATNRILAKDGYGGHVFTQNRLTGGSSAAITFEDDADYLTSVCHSNTGDNSDKGMLLIGHHQIWPDGGDDLAMATDATSYSAGAKVGMQS